MMEKNMGEVIQNGRVSQVIRFVEKLCLALTGAGTCGDSSPVCSSN